MGSSLGTLLKHNLIKGSLATGSGVFMHDIVRDYVIHQHSEEERFLIHRSADLHFDRSMFLVAFTCHGAQEERIRRSK